MQTVSFLNAGREESSLANEANEKRITHTNESAQAGRGETHANGRLMEQAVWQWTGKQNARTKMQ